MRIGFRQLAVRGLIGSFLCFILVLAGCGGGKGDVSGVVKYKGQPLKFGTVTFQALTGGPVSAEIQSDGTYKALGVPSGTAKVGVSAVDPAIMQHFRDASAKSKSIQKGEGGGGGDGKKFGNPSQFYVIPTKYSDPTGSGLSFDVKTGENTYNIDLEEKP